MKTLQDNILELTTSKVAIFPKDEHQTATESHVKVSLATGLSLELIETSVIVNYGVGGFLQPHKDTNVRL